MAEDVLTAPREDALLRHYVTDVAGGDLMLEAASDLAPHWRDMLSGLAAAGTDDFAPLQDRVARQVQDLGMAFRLAGEDDERSWPLSPIPLLIGSGEWATIERAMAQRADLLEQVIGDVYGPQNLIRSGAIPAPVITGSTHFWQQMVGVTPPQGRHLHFYAADLARGPDGEWRVLSDLCRTPTGAGYALENRLALSRATGDLLSRLNVRRLAPFFSAFRQGLAAVCERTDPRIALLTPGRFTQSYAEQAHLARYLGFLLVEGDDLTVRGDRLYVRTIEGIKRIDAIWRRMDTSLLDPLEFDARTRIGVPDLFQAISNGGLAVANWPGSGIIESRAFAAFLPKLAREVLGEDLLLPNIATWWCGQPAERAKVLANIDNMAVGSAFGEAVPGLEDGRSHIGATLSADRRALLMDAMERRPMDYVGQELVRVSTTPAVLNGRMVARPFTLRVFVTRDSNGAWRTMPGGFARLAAHGDIRAVLMGEGDMSADVCIVGSSTQTPVSLLDTSPSPPIRRIAGTLPSRAADNLFWLARYLERGENTLRIVRALLGGSIEADGGAALDQGTMGRMTAMLVSAGAARQIDLAGSVTALARAAIGSSEDFGSVHSLIGSARTIGQGMRDRLAVDFWRLLAKPLAKLEQQAAEPMLGRLADLLDRFSALSGLAAENMGRSHGWRFHDLGRRIERAVTICRLLRTFARDDASADDLNVLLDLCDCQIMYRMRYLSGISLYPARDMLALEAQNPRSLAFQMDLIVEHLAALPSLRDDGMPEPPMKIATSLSALLAAASAETLGNDALEDIENHLLALSDAVGARFFLRGKEAERAAGVTRLA
ncbi:MAG TPA: circularly permuted type 2 ATP-grasp protein [Sphingobium sp.]